MKENDFWFNFYLIFLKGLKKLDKRYYKWVELYNEYKKCHSNSRLSVIFFLAGLRTLQVLSSTDKKTIKKDEILCSYIYYTLKKNLTTLKMQFLKFKVNILQKSHSQVHSDLK